MTTSTPHRTDARLRIDLWSDVVCPWCYLGAARLRKAIDGSPRADSIDLVLHAYELDPTAPARARPNLEYLTAKFGVPAAQVEEMEAGMAARAAAEGLPYTAHRPHAATFDIHRLLAHAAQTGAAEPLMTVLQRELFSGGRDVFDHAVLADLAAEVGLDRGAAAEVLAGTAHTGDVRADIADAQRIGVRGVPFAVLAGRLGVSGASEVDGYAHAIERAWEIVDEG
ncbi:DsbA family oxidoreductase [Pseudonocardia humida]|uniref:DsbA family oxidoreductase n=1 Tax=Pseudonocardia humida TaxID=2800819 RepID=A0ABT0ZYT4_9PSEU|nr:DsbA family oxidoreductase [Pseudonocardia humida]MCO1655814.1 DsbA family oxidoreductase [Pseudonocardia humida]